VYTLILWWLAGIIPALAWLVRVAGAARGMPFIPEISGEDWNLSAPRNPRLSVIVPALNEEENVEAALRSLVAQDYQNLEIIAINDRSTDSTGEVMERVAAESAGRLRVLHIDHLPEGWLGKPHAMWRGAQLASGDWLLFTDADVIFRKDALRRALAYGEASRADHLVVFPTLIMKSAGERMMVAFFQSMFLFMSRPWKISDPNARDAVGVGAFNLLRRDAYEKVGSFAKLRMEVVEDLRLGELIKEHRLAQRVAFGKDLISIRWLRGAFGAVRNLTKNFFAIMQYRWWLSLLAAAGLFFLVIAPYMGVILAPGWAKIPYSLTLLCILATYIGMSRHSEISPLYFLLHPVAGALYIYAILRSTFVTLRHGGVDWRGTQYSLEELRKGIAAGDS